MTTKLRKVEEVRAPKSINDMPYGAAQTKARREFLAAVVAEKVAAGFVAKVIGKGSYQTVAVYETLEVETRDQLRGTCQRCGGSVAVVNGVLAHHGYTRPGYGYILGDCMGTNREPAEKSVDLAKSLRAVALEDAANMERRADEVDAADKLGERPEVTKLRAALAEITAAPATSHDARERRDNARKALNAEIHRAAGLRSDARSARQYAEFVASFIVPRLGKDLSIVKIPVEGR